MRERGSARSSFTRCSVSRFTSRHGNDAVAVVRNAHDVEFNLVYNANADAGGRNILMDVGETSPKTRRRAP